MKSQPSKADLNRSREHVNNVIKEATEAIYKQQKPDDFDTLIVKKVNALSIECFNEFKRMHNLAVVPMKKEDAIEHIRKLYKDKMKDWTKDELVEAFCLVQAVLGAESFHNELI